MNPNQVERTADLSSHDGEDREPAVRRPTRALYSVVETMDLLNLSRSQIYELIRCRRLRTVTEGRRRLVPASAIDAYVALLVHESNGDAA